MVKITDGVHTMEVSMGAYKGIFSKQGYTLVDEGNEPEVAPEVAPEAGGHESESNDGDKAFLTELKEKPLSSGPRVRLSVLLPCSSWTLPAPRTSVRPRPSSRPTWTSIPPTKTERRMEHG